MQIEAADTEVFETLDRQEQYQEQILKEAVISPYEYILFEV